MAVTYPANTTDGPRGGTTPCDSWIRSWKAGAAVCFVVGSVLLFSAGTTYAADRLFLVGSILFAVKPTIDLVRSSCLRKLPVDTAS